MKDLIFEIFTTISEEAMQRNCAIELRYTNKHHDNNSIIVKTKTDLDELAMTISPEGICERSYEDGYDDGCMDLIDEDIETD